MDKIIYASATELAQAIRNGDISSREVIDAYLQRIEEVNPKINAVVQLVSKEARAQAKEGDADVKK
ncbi:MAG: amidase family protein, partial [Candidatus Thorarchaeota archaeon]